MLSSPKWATCWLALTLGVSCSLDDRRPAVATTPVITPCPGETDAPPCADGEVQTGANGSEPLDPDAAQGSGCGDDGDTCDDSLFCTVGDTCAAGECRGTARECDDKIACTLGDSCDEDRDQCLPGAAQCSAGFFCDAASGECTSSCSGCALAGVCHAEGAANPVNPCEVCAAAVSADAFSAAASTVACDDGVACTENDHCESGSCAGTALACAADQRCVESTGTCVGGYALALALASVAVTQGASASVSLTLVRDEGHALPVDVTVQGLPPGVSAEGLQLSGSDGFATLTLSADARAAEGVRTPLTVRASDGLSVVAQALELFVRGEPGTLDLSFGSGGTSRASPPGAPGFQGTVVVVDGDDRILVGATSRFVLDPLDVPARASLTRFSSNGALDEDFADGGTYLETPGSSGLAQGPTTFVGGVALAPDGYVLAGPLGEGNPQEASYLTRLDADGDRANGFAPTLGGGLRLLDVAVENGTIFAVGDDLSNPALYRSDLSGGGGLSFSDNSMLSAMQAVFWSPADNEFILAGSCDPSPCFAHFNGERTPPTLDLDLVTNAPSTASILDATADVQGRYFALATGWNLVRFLPQPVRPPGALPFTVVVDDLVSRDRLPRSIELAGDRLYVSASLASTAGEAGVPAVVRYATTLARDTRFAVGGVAELDGSVDVGSTVDVAVQSDGRIILAAVDRGELVVYRVWD